MPYGGSPSTDDQDAVMAMVGDTDLTDQLLDDDTYTLILATEGALYSRAALAASMIAGKYAREMRKRVGSLWRFAEQQFQHYNMLAASMRLEAQRKAKAEPFGGGISKADVDTRNEDTDRVKPSFEIGMQTSVNNPDGGKRNPQLSDTCVS